jgi:molecular chaperone Hsp33
MDHDDGDIVLMGANDNTYDDMILPFQLESSHLRGRVVRLGTVLHDILSPHAYPSGVGQLVAEAVTLAPLLGGMLKFDGTFTLQAQGDGPVRLVVADLTTAGALRGMASFDLEKLSAAGLADPTVTTLRAHDKTHELASFMGAGVLAFTVDQGEHADRYQGIVELHGVDLAQSVADYFSQSEQIDTVLRVGTAFVNGDMRAGGIMIQRLPLPDDVRGDDMAVAAAREDWDRARALLETCRPGELTDGTLPASDLLYRLFHEEGVRVFNPVQLSKGCRCTTEKLSGILATMPDEDRDHMRVNGKITMTCEFCNKDFVF